MATFTLTCLTSPGQLPSHTSQVETSKRKMSLQSQHLLVIFQWDIYQQQMRPIPIVLHLRVGAVRHLPNFSCKALRWPMLKEQRSQIRTTVTMVATSVSRPGCQVRDDVWTLSTEETTASSWANNNSTLLRTIENYKEYMYYARNKVDCNSSWATSSQIWRNNCCNLHYLQNQSINPLDQGKL